MSDPDHRGICGEALPRAKTVLCVEDEIDLRTDIAEELSAAGYAVVQAANGREALARLDTVRPDLILCDITMPELNGYEFMAKVRSERGDLAEVPFVFLTALADRAEMLNGKNAGADDYLVKPVDYDDLLATIRSRLRLVERVRASLLQELEREQRRLIEQAVRDGEVALAGVMSEAGSTRTLALERSEGHPLLLQLSCVGLPGSDVRHAVALVVDPDRQADISPELLASLFGCTAAEARLAAALVAGKKLEDICEEFGVKQTTVTFHLQNLFQKTRTRRQADLVALLIRAAMPLSLRG